MATPTRRRTKCADCGRPAPKGMCAACRDDRKRLYAMRRAEGYIPRDLPSEVADAMRGRVARLQERFAAGLPLSDRPRPRGPYALVETRTA